MDPLPAVDQQTKSPRIWEWLHILSLEAPIVACAWQWSLAHHHQVRLLPAVYWGLALAAWGIYILDRTLDGYSGMPLEQTTRHRFYQRHRGANFFVVLPITAVCVGYLGLWKIPEGLLWQASAIAVMATVYLASFAARQSKVARDLLFSITGLGAIILLSKMPISGDMRLIASLGILSLMFFVMAKQFNSNARSKVPKEIAAGILFALGSTAAIRFYAQEENVLPALLETALMSGLFICNLTSITEAELAHLEESARSKELPLSSAKWLSAVSTMAIAAWIMAVRANAGHHLQTLAQAILMGTILVAALRQFRHRLHPTTFRALADFAMLPPLLHFWI